MKNVENGISVVKYKKHFVILQISLRQNGWLKSKKCVIGYVAYIYTHACTHKYTQCITTTTKRQDERKQIPCL
jgi:hypothetical protein